MEGRMARRLGRWAGAWLPHRCLLCDGPGGAGLDLCDACRSVLPALQRPLHGLLACIACGDAVAPREARADAAADAAVAMRCQRCRERCSPFAQLIAPWRFAAPVDAWVRALKHDHALPIARVFGTVIARAVAADPASTIDATNGRWPYGVPGCPPGHSPGRSPGPPSGRAPVLLPVPLHPSRLRERGFNHAEAIADWIAREAGLTVHADSARRILDTGSLAERSRAERQLVIRGAFRVHEDIAERHVVLVDDVLTSGATAGELARECLDTGAASVSLWVAARTCAEPLIPAGSAC